MSLLSSFVRSSPDISVWIIHTHLKLPRFRMELLSLTPCSKPVSSLGFITIYSFGSNWSIILGCSLSSTTIANQSMSSVHFIYQTRLDLICSPSSPPATPHLGHYKPSLMLLLPFCLSMQEWSPLKKLVIIVSSLNFSVASHILRTSQTSFQGH